MNIHVFCNAGQRVLLDRYFKPSLRDEWTLVEHALTTPIAADFGTLGFKRLIREKVSRLISEVFPLERSQSNPYFIVSDIDIQFFGRCEAVVRDTIARADMAFQSEFGVGRVVNTGFIAMRPNPGVEAFWIAVQNTLAAHEGSSEFINEQQVVNDMLEAGVVLDWGIFPDEIWAFSNQRLRPLDERFSKILLHHANTTVPQPGRSSLELKLEQLDLVAKTLAEWEAQRPRRTLRRNYLRFRELVSVAKRTARRVTGHEA